MLHYILQTIAFQLFFLLIYDLFLRRETFFNWNRIYLLITAIASVILPFVKLEGMRAIVPPNFVVRLPEVIIGGVPPVSEIATESIINQAISSQFIWKWDNLIYLGMIVASFILFYKIIKITLLIQKNPKRWNGNLVLVHLVKSNLAFSFFHYVFLGEYIKEEERETIIAHESVHVNQKHTWDLIFFEALRIVFWFNPLIYIYQNRMTTLHEFIADAKAVKKGNKAIYYQNLLSQVFDTQQISFTNTFYKQSLIKKRIVMLSKSKSNRIFLLKYALLIPMVFGMLMYTSSYAQTNTAEEMELLQEYSFDQLVDKYYKEISELSEKGLGMQKIQQNYDMSYKPIVKDKYIKNMDEVARMKAYTQWSAENYIKMAKKNASYTEQNLEYAKKAISRYATYESYVAFQKTDEAKSNWESDIQDGILRLVVDDFKNLTETEKNKQQEKIDLILKDDYYHGLIVTDGIASSKLEIDKPKNVEEEKEFESYDIEVPFSVIDEVPTIDECRDLETNEEKRRCFSNYISDFVNKNFNTNLAKELGLKGRQRINVLFKIGKDGNINKVMARAPHPALETEAMRVIKALPQMTPGIQKGKAVVVPYSLPILFQVSE